MFNRFRIALACALLAAIIISISVYAKGGFAFIAITGADLKETVRATDSALTHDFFAFADFSRSQAETPADPGMGYEITRYYIDNNREIAFDKLHYYPDTGVVFYDGIVNGSSEYDGKWYAAKAEIKAAFESALTGTTLTVLSSSKPIEQTQKDPTLQQSQPNSEPLIVPQFAMLVVIAGGLAIVLILFPSRRRRAHQ